MCQLRNSCERFPLRTTRSCSRNLNLLQYLSHYSFCEMVELLSFVRLSSHLGFGNLRRVTKITKKPYYSQARSLSKEVSLIRRGAFKTAVLLTSIACSASEAAAPGNVFDRRPDRVPGLYEHFSQAAVIFAFADHTIFRNVTTQTMFIRHTATELQRRIAAQNAKTYYARLGAGKKNELKKKKIRYLAVPTVRSKQTSSQS